MGIDAVIPAHEKDFSTLPYAVRGLLRHMKPLGRVFVVSNQRFEWPNEQVRWVPEPDEPHLPSFHRVRDRLRRADPMDAGRPAWIYQQLLKLGAGRYIEGLSPAYLAMDADVIFLRKVSFSQMTARFPYSRATEYHPSYQAAYHRLLGSKPTLGFSFVAHHMLYDRALLSELFDEIEQRQDEAWYWAYADVVDPTEQASISEWDIYGNWMLERHPELSCHHQLFWREESRVPGILGRAVLGIDYDFVAAHAYRREPRRLRWRTGLGRLIDELREELRRAPSGQRPMS
jgi:hypothetical protein